MFKIILWLSSQKWEIVSLRVRLLKSLIIKILLLCGLYSVKWFTNDYEIMFDTVDAVTDLTNK